MALLIFASQVIQKISFAEDRKKILDALASLKDRKKVSSQGRAQNRPLDSLVTASDMLEPPQPGDAIFVITDGGDNLSHRHGREDAERAFKIRAIRVFAIMPISPQTRTPEEEEGSSRLVELTKETGGNPVAFPQRYMTPAELAPALIPLFRQMNEIYRLEVELPQAPDKFRSWKLEFAEPRTPKTKHATIIYPRQLAPCQ